MLLHETAFDLDELHGIPKEKARALASNLILLIETVRSLARRCNVEDAGASADGVDPSRRGIEGNLHELAHLVTLVGTFCRLPTLRDGSDFIRNLHANLSASESDHKEADAIAAELMVARYFGLGFNEEKLFKFSYSDVLSVDEDGYRQLIIAAAREEVVIEQSILFVKTLYLELNKTKKKAGPW